MKLKKRFYALILSMFACLTVLAVPARPRPIMVSQPDGTTLTYYVHGDEYCHWLQTADGVLVIQGDDEAFYYAVADADGVMVSSRLLAHDEKMRTEAERLFVVENRKAAESCLAKRCEVARSKRAMRPRKMGAGAARVANGIDKYRGAPVKGKQNVLVILAEFADVSMSVSNPQQAFSDQYNKKGYNLNGHIGSVRDYFHDQSYGQYDVSFDVVGPVRLPQKMAYYGKNRSDGSDYHPGEMVGSACKLVDGEVDFSKYDNDGDGYVDQVYVIYAGYDEAESGVANQIWAHRYDLYSCKIAYQDGPGMLTLDGVKVNTYACSSELSGSEGKDMQPIGTFCHEFSHCLGLMDTYDVKYGGGFGMQDYDLMGGGNYNGPLGRGEVPCGYTAYERWYLGWLDLVELSSPACVREMPSLGDKPVAYFIRNDRQPSEFFTLENRQNKDWFSYAYYFKSCHGMLITHIDYSKNVWEQNEINTTKSHQRLSYVPADNNYGSLEKYSDGSGYYYSISEDNLAGDLFPGLYDVTEFTDDSHALCGGRLFNNNLDGSRKLGKPVTNISEKDGLISFDFMGGDYTYISEVSILPADAELIYDASGNRVASMDVPGMYVVKCGGVTRKVLVR